MHIDRLGLVKLIEQAEAIEAFEEAVAAAARALPADPSAILEFFEIPTGDAFDVKPDQAIAYFRAKGLKPTFSYADMMDQAHDYSFTVAKMMDVDMLGQVRASLDSALANGQPFKEWADSITPILQSAGWWGRKEVVDPLTGQTIVAQLGSPWRLETIFRTNMQTAYAAGAWQEIEAQKDIAPFLMYDAVDDIRTRPLHRAWDRTILPVDHSWWDTHYPPNGYNCRCGVIQLSQDDLEALGVQANTDPPKSGSYEWKNPRTGEELIIPKGIDPGFTHNSGQSWKFKQKQLLKEKIAALPRDMAAAANKAAKRAEALGKQMIEAAQSAQLELASDQAKAALARAQAMADEKAKQWAAQAQLEAIAKGKETAGKGAVYKIKALQQLKKEPTWPELKPTEQLAMLEELATELKVKAETSSKLSLYKKAVLEGKTPSPAMVKAFNTLTEEEKTAFLAKVDKEKAALEAKKAAEAAEAAKKAAGATPSAGALAPEPPPPDPLTMVMIGRKTKGGTEGAFYQDTATGAKYLVKFNGSEDAVLNEVLAGRLYNLAGVEAPELHYITLGGRPALASRLVDGIAEVDAKTLAANAAVQEGFAVDAWLANWDSIGLNYDNTVLVGSRALRIDVGGSLRYRALGGLKGNAFGRQVGEIESLRDGTNPQARAVFGSISQAQIERGVEKVLRVSDADIRAAVEKYGPRDAAERRLLADTLIERKADLARRYPAAADRVRRDAQAAQEPQGQPARVTDQEQAFIDDSRVNGYGMATDADQIEENMVTVSTLKRASGDWATRGWFKLREPAMKKLQASLPGASAAAPSVTLSDARSAILDSIKSINHRAATGKPIEDAKRAQITSAISIIRGRATELRQAAQKAASAQPLQAQADLLEGWAQKLEEALAKTPLGAPPANLGVFDASSIPDRLSYALPSGPQQVAGLAWRRIDRQYEFEVAKFDRSFATETGRTASVDGVRVYYEADLPDGAKVQFFPDSVAFAMRGVVKIDVPGRGKDATAKIFEAMEQAGIDSRRATEAERKHTYLNAYARLRLVNSLPNGARLRAEFAAIGDSGEEAVQRKLELLKRATGVEVAASEGWRNIDGVRQAFGHGRAYQLRPDLDPDELQQMGKTRVVFHNPRGLGTEAGFGVFDRIKIIIEGGGMMSSLVDRVRRGVELNGSSVASDLDTGGGDYFFTRILGRARQHGRSGIYWRTSVLRRMDAISYDSDQFGQTKGTHIESNRKGQGVQSLSDLANSSSNETIFKHGLSIFDDLEKIVLKKREEVNDAIAWMKAKGYRAWPDGRRLEDVIVFEG